MDIVERLRSLYVQDGTNYVQEAAQEIERLRAEGESLRRDADRYRFLCECDTGNLHYWLHETQGEIGTDLTAGIDAAIAESALHRMTENAEVLGLYDKP